MSKKSEIVSTLSRQSATDSGKQILSTLSKELVVAYCEQILPTLLAESFFVRLGITQVRLAPHSDRWSSRAGLGYTKQTPYRAQHFFDHRSHNSPVQPRVNQCLARRAYSWCSLALPLKVRSTEWGARRTAENPEAPPHPKLARQRLTETTP